MKEVIKKLSVDRSWHGTENVKTFESEKFGFSDLKQYTDELLKLHEPNLEIQPIVDAYYKKDNEREFNLLIREKILQFTRKEEGQRFLEAVALRIACESALDEKIKSFFVIKPKGVSLANSKFL